MIATSHVIISGTAALAVGAITKNPAVALSVGVITHLLCDTLPHLDTPSNSKYDSDDEIVWDKNLYAFAIADSLVAVITVLLIWYSKDKLSLLFPFAWGAFGGYLPDLIDNFPLWRKQAHRNPILKNFHKFHLQIHNNWRRYYPMPKHWKLGVITQLIIVIPCLFYLLK